MAEISEICFNCKFWQADPTALDRKHIAIARRISPRTDVPAALYGKCRVQTIAKGGQPYTYDMGTLAQQECKAFDYDSYPLFQPVPED